MFRFPGMFLYLRSFRVFWSGSAAALALVVLSQPAPAQDTGNLADTLSRLERQLLSLERTVYRGDPPPPVTATPPQSSGLNNAAASRIQIRIDQFEQEMRSLTGQIERMSFDVRQVASRLDKLVADVDFRLRTLEQGGANLAEDDGAAPDGGQPLVAEAPETFGAGPPAGAGANSTVRIIGQLTEEQIRDAAIGPTAAAAPAPAAVQLSPPAAAVELPDGPPAEQYNYARSFLMRRDFTSAEAAFRNFIDANPDSDLVGNAQYWLGETFYVRENYLDAARAFAEGYQNFPASAKAPDNLLKLGLALANLDRKDDACITLSRLGTEYPDAAANIRQRAEREHARLGCS